MRGYFMFVRVWAGERDLVTILVSTISFLMYIRKLMVHVSALYVGHLQVVILTFGVAIQCAGLFYVCKGLGRGTRSRYYTSEYHKFSYVHTSEYHKFSYVHTSEYHKFSYVHMYIRKLSEYHKFSYVHMYIRKLMVLTSIVTRSRTPAQTLTNIK